MHTVMGRRHRLPPAAQTLRPPETPRGAVQVAPYFHEFAAAHPSQQVLYATVLLDGNTLDKCRTWHSRGGFGDTWGVTLNDSAARHFQTLFGWTRPQFFVLAPSGEFLDISPNTECGQVRHISPCTRAQCLPIASPPYPL